MNEGFNNINLEVIKRDESRQLKAVAIEMEEKGIDLFDSDNFYRNVTKHYVRQFGYSTVNEYLKYLAEQICNAVVVPQTDDDPQFVKAVTVKPV